MSMKWTPEPWTYVVDQHGDGEIGADRKHSSNGTTFSVASILWDNSGEEHPSQSVAAINGKRIVACVNACAGINPEAVPKLLKACKDIRNWHEYPSGRGPMDLDTALRNASAAIAKAESRGPGDIEFVDRIFGRGGTGRNLANATFNTSAAEPQEPKQ